MQSLHLHGTGSAGLRHVAILHCQLLLRTAPSARYPISFRAASTGVWPAASEELLSRIKDKNLVKTMGFIGGEWTPASDGSTYSVRASRSTAVKRADASA